MPPSYDPAHSHGTYDIAGYDVVRTRWSPPEEDLERPIRIEVLAVVHGATNYDRALQLAKAERGPNQQWAYVCDRYTDGCRAVANQLHPVGPYPAPEFTDLPEAEVAR